MSWRQKLAESRQKSLEASNKIREELKQGKERHFRKLLEEATRQEAYLLWEADGKPKDKDDYYWHQSVERLRDLYRRNQALKRLQIKRGKEKRSLRRFAAWLETTPVEHFFEDIAFILKNAAILDIINFVASITLILSLITWWTGRQERREDEQFSTWRVLQNVHGDKSGVAKVAAERFNRQGFSLAGLDFQEANFYNTNLKEANLSEANFLGADLRNANLQDSYLVKTNFEGANLEGANLKGANLAEANFTDANLTNADFQKADFLNVELKGAILLGTDIRQAYIYPHYEISWLDIEDALICNPGTSFNYFFENQDRNRDCDSLLPLIQDFNIWASGEDAASLVNKARYKVWDQKE